jgi:hypothetical protein
MSEPELSQEECDAIWDEAKAIAKDQLGEAALGGTYDSDFPSMNPYAKGTLRHEEYEAAHEHFIMTGLGY